MLYVYTVNIFVYNIFVEKEKKYHHENLRQELINEGLKMLNDDGLELFSIRKLSLRLGVSHAATYRHFADKESLLKAILNDSAEKFYNALVKSVEDISDPREKLYKLGTGYVLFFVENPQMLSLFNLSAKISLDELSCQAGKEDSSFAFFRQIVENSSLISQYKNLSETEILLGLWGKVHGLASVLIFQKENLVNVPQNEIIKIIDKIIRTSF